MKTSSAKAKGRRLQQTVAKAICKAFDLPESDVKSLPMGAQGCDVWLSGAALLKFPFSVECKNVEKLNVWKAWEQAEANSIQSGHPLVVFSRNRSKVLAVIEFDTLLGLLSEHKTKT